MPLTSDVVTSMPLNALQADYRVLFDSFLVWVPPGLLIVMVTLIAGSTM
jgi:hypothetical protein